MVNLEQKQHQPLYETIYRQLRAEITGGQRKAGEKLPSKRALAQTLGVSLNTVETAYHQLESEGYIQPRPKSGFYVLPLEHLPGGGRVEHTALQRPRRPAAAVDFSTGAVDAARFPMTVWQRLVRGALAEPGVLTRSEPQGDPGLREEIARYLARARGVHCQPEQLVLGPGTDYLLAVLSHILPGSCALGVENPVYNKAYVHFARMGHRVFPAEIDRKGVLVEPLEGQDNLVVYTTPSHQYPLGVSMPMGRRTQLLNWCRQGRFRYVIEDDYDSEFRYDARPLPSLQSIDRDGRVIYLGTMSGVMAPSVRVSYLLLPPELLERFWAVEDIFPCVVSTLEQLALRDFMQQGYFEKHLNRMRVCYRDKRQLLLRLLQPYRRLEVIGMPAGSYLSIRVHNGMNERQLCDAALEQGVRVYPISPYFMGQMPSQYESKVLLGFGALDETALHDGVARLARAWQLG